MIIHLKNFFLYDFTATLLTLLQYDSTKDFVISLRLNPCCVRTVHSKLQILDMQSNIDEVYRYVAISVVNS